MPVLASLAACTPVAITSEIGYARFEVGGELALGTGSGGFVAQDVAEAFGLGSPQDAPHVRLVADFGATELSAEGFWFAESGAGVLTQSFGGLPAGTSVVSELELGNARLAATIAVPLGPLTIAPGVLFDVFSVDFRASSSPGNREEVDEIVGVPMPFVRAELPVFGLSAALEIGHLDPPDFVGVDGRFLDAEARLQWHPATHVHLVAGYRHLSADAEGESATESVGIDLRIRGWFVGGGLRF